ncbi:PAS domain-containing protein [Hymenobacter sp. HMF4947]|uniref:histidine kinase n=1 Tax=Hymenobacter ginkgonis TaxID=2682976 RepID=A0A7K1TC87_9BACT|nr:PAS domain-containing protein [Hymenobacter ginkgonis]MVN75932.1 PAS domain-containing protein [Hymenobacter ginkgonis]
MSAPATPIATPYFEPDPLLHDLLAVSLTAINLLRPCYSPAGELNDFAPEYFNSAAQRMTGLPERPVGTARTLFPAIFGNGIFAFYRQVFETGEPDQFQLYYQADGLDNYFHIAARRSGDWLWVSFTDTADQSRTGAENALRQTQAAEVAARAEAELQRQRFHEVLMQLPAPVAVYHGPAHTYQFVNMRYQHIFPLRSFAGRPFRDAMPESVGLGVAALFDQVYQSGVPFYGHELEGWFDFDGTGERRQLFFNLYLHPLRNAQGVVDGLLDFAYDVTEQVLARRQLQQLNQELETRVAERSETALALQADVLAAAQRQVAERESFYQVFEQTPAAICIQRGPEHRYEYANQAYRDFFPGRPLLGQPVAEALPETVDSGVVALLDRVYQTGEPYEGIELPLLIAQPQGPPRQMYFTFTYQPYRENGEIVGISTFAYNVAEQVLARHEREAQQRRLQAIFEQAPVAIFVLHGPNYILDVVNPFMSEVLGRTPDELLGQPYFEAMPELASQGYAAFMDQVWHTGQPFTAREQPAKLKRHQAGETGYFTFVYQPLFDAQGQLTDIMCVALDETEQVRARQQVQSLNEELAAINEELMATNEELNESNTRLMRTNVDLDTFVYTASHDLKAPITNIESIVLALRSTLPPAVQQDEVVNHLLGLLDTTVTRFQFTIGQLTDISRLQLAHAGPAEPVLLAQAIENVRLDLAPNMVAANTQLTVEVPAELVVSFSPANLRSIVYNLLSNAIKYRAPNRPPQVLIRAEQTTSAVVLSVHDNGLGMSEVQQRQLFGLFQRLHTHVEGTGVGLYISKRLVENGGGTIAVQSQVDAGATFTVTFPA